MLSDVIKHLDYDIWKEMFGPEGYEPDEIAELVKIAKSHLPTYKK